MNVTLIILLKNISPHIVLYILASIHIVNVYHQSQIVRQIEVIQEVVLVKVS